MSDEATLSLTQSLIRLASVTPDDAGCLDLIGERLSQLGFTLERMRFDDVDNLWATRGSGEPVFTFAGHTDVVPTGDLDAWNSPPFEPSVRDGLLFGRGAADMKGSLAAMVTALERFIEHNDTHRGTLSLLLTSDEEGIAINGTVKVIEALKKRGQKIDWCLIGEPSSATQLGDVIRNGRRGSLNAHLKIKGVQGHVAYPEKVRNPIHEAAGAIAALSTTRWDEGNAFYPPTSFQISNINAGTGAENVVPGELELKFNFRFSTESTVESLQQRTLAILDEHKLNYDIDWHLSGNAFLTPGGPLLDAVKQSIAEVLSVDVDSIDWGRNFRWSVYCADWRRSHRIWSNQRINPQNRRMCKP